jgi:hypothetical protein
MMLPEKDPELDALRDRLRSEGRFWGDCRCGRPLDRHSRRQIPNAGISEYVCAETDSGRYEPVTLPELDWTPGNGVHRPSASGRTLTA